MDKCSTEMCKQCLIKKKKKKKRFCYKRLVLTSQFNPSLFPLDIIFGTTRDTTYR